MKNAKLARDERALSDSLEAGEWSSVARSKSEIRKHVQYAGNTLKKDKRVNIRISSRDLEQIQTIALRDGIPYQTLMSSILHRFVSGRLAETKKS